jgi:hypothetical protein
VHSTCFIPGAHPHSAGESVYKNVTEIPTLNHIYLWSRWLGKCTIAQAPGSYPTLPEVNFLMVEIPTPRPYIFMIRVTKQIKCLIAHAPGGHTHPLTEVIFLMVEIPTPKPYIFMIRVTRQIKCLIVQAPGGHIPPSTWSELFNGWDPHP